MRLTMSRHRDGKIVMPKDLPILKNCILGALERRRKKLHESLQLKCSSVLSSCLTRATDWDNHRSKSKKSDQNQKTLSDYIAKEEMNENSDHNT
ncbi:hypothetical protein HCN44_009079 [Aphidius gifuensis]|uniref:Uncharacterized protein n=2 Tax=Aphidius gifuensis TaxID=684658 RepID=A0A834XN09_APHGI|nr:hypothetical protein HCN44_009079 [Aphidius gifuensis]